MNLCRRGMFFFILISNYIEEIWQVITEINSMPISHHAWAEWKYEPKWSISLKITIVLHKFPKVNGAYQSTYKS